MRFLLVLATLVYVAVAQTSTTPTPTPQPAVNTGKPIWRCNLPGGIYQVLSSAIVSVSSHEYMVDGVARVMEVNVDTSGHLAVRFYFIEGAVTSGPGGLGAATLSKVQSVLTEAAERSGTEAWKKVVKSYPATTHARTVEYRVGGKDSLNKIFASATRCMTAGKSEELTISD